MTHMRRTQNYLAPRFAYRTHVATLVAYISGDALAGKLFYFSRH
jgi:hypothetical protein